MRHAYFGRKLGRDTNARKALANNLASALLSKGRIETTLAKAKFARVFVEKLITQAKKKGLGKTRIIASQLTGRALDKLLFEIGPGFANRPGGYTRIIRLNPRAGDAAPMARLELMPVEKKTPAPKTTTHQAEKKPVKEQATKNESDKSK